MLYDKDIREPLFDFLEESYGKITDQKSEDIGYQPSMDINQLNVAILLDRLDTYGSENFKIDKDEEFNDEWKVLTESREEYYKKASKVLLKDL